MQKILANTSLGSKELRNRDDVPPLLKTAIHRFYHQSKTTFDNWLLLLNGSEKQTVNSFLEIKTKP